MKEWRKLLRLRQTIDILLLIDRHWRKLMKLKIKEVDQLAQITIVRSGHGFVWTSEIGN